MATQGTILHVADNVAKLQASSRLLRQAHYTVIEAQGGQVALQSARQVQPQLIILNGSLSDIASAEVCQRLKSDAVTAASLVLQIAVAGDEPLEGGWATSPDFYLMEPFAAGELLSAVTMLRRLWQSELHLQQQQRFLQALQATTPIILYIHDLIEQRTVYCTEYARSEFGLPAAPVAPQFAPFHPDSLHPEDQARAVAYRAGFATLDDSALHEFTYRQRHKSGDWHWFCCQSKIFQRTPAHEPQQIIGVVLDITEQKATETAFYENYRLLQGVINNSSDGIYVRDLQGHYLLANTVGAQMIGLQPEGVIGQEYSALLPAAVVEEIEAEDRFVLAQGKAQTTEVAYAVEGITRTFHAVKTPYRDVYGNVVGILSVARDITERKAAEAQLRQLNEALEERVAERTAELQRSNHELNQFAYVASHDLRAPLRSIEHLAGWLAEDALELLPAPSQEHLRKLRSRVKRMEQLLEDLLAYSRAGRVQHPREVVDLEQMVKGIVELLAPPPAFVISTPESPPPIITTRVPLETVLRNLIGNAIKHHHQPEGRVQVVMRVGTPFTHFTIEDDGPGIAAEFHQRIFELFQTLQSRDRVEGSGMGLAVVKKLVESYGGVIEVASQPQQGATFTFTWPTSLAAEKS